MSYVIKVEGFATDEPCPIAGQYFVRWDTGEMPDLETQEFHFDLKRAHHFDQLLDAMDMWRRESTKMPGQRPMTALTCSFEFVGDDNTSFTPGA